ncbi:MAG: dimethyladenosine transferase [Ilumatobacter coccineus]|uniref:Dimethyladenosine transferase n=1 Tax=Ilumatobacter coccineus TaxID=467094 RepID=A0A2G6KFM2_9ACTN|nr:MAG: dimethyladenosine transferase [Ilumatobacter coccineus]
MAERVISQTVTIAAPPNQIFALLADPARHAEIDGSDTVQGTRSTTEPLTSGSTFSMKMKLGPIPYRITNRVVEFQHDRLIAWQHFGGHRWRYELEPTTTDTGTPATRVTESFDWSTSRIPWLIERARYPARHRINIAATLERLAAVITGEAASGAAAAPPEDVDGMASGSESDPR